VCRAYWYVYAPLSMLAWGSELRFRRRCTSLTLPLTSLNSASVWGS
jgi:hypothetical protein